MPKLAPKSATHKGRRKPPKAGIKSTPKNSHTSPFQIQRRKFIATALDYRIKGHAFEKIGQAMAKDYGNKPVPISTVRDWIVEGMDALPREPAETLRKMMIERVMILLGAHFPQAASGNVEKTNVVLRVMERASKLLGLDVPEQLDLTGAVATAAMTGHAPSDNDRARQLAAFIAMTRARKEAETGGDK